MSAKDISVVLRSLDISTDDVTISLLSFGEKNLLYFFGTISGLKLGCTCDITFQSIGADFKIIGAMIFISLLHDDALLPLTVQHREIKQIFYDKSEIS